MDNSGVPCAQSGCTAVVLSGRGYCSRHGGPGRLAREQREARAAARERENEEQAERRQRNRGLHWGTSGAPVGTGLTRLAKLDAAKRQAEAAVEPTDEET